jgi:hypothetical protein
MDGSLEARSSTARGDGMLAMNRLWHELLQEAIHEADPAKAGLKIERAERAILLRLRDSSPGLSAAEEQALFEALGTVRALRSARRLPQRPGEGSAHPQHHR